MERTRAIVLRRVDYSETSQVLHLYTRDAGKVHAIAKGAKRRKGSFTAPFDLFLVYDTQRIAKRRGELDLLTSADIVRAFPNLRRQWVRYCCGSYFLELVDLFTLEGVPQTSLYDLLETGLERLDGEEDPTATVFRFEARLIALLGHAPRLSECGLCRLPVRGREAFYSPRDGGAVCPRCKPRDPRRVLVPVEILGALKRYGSPDTPVKLQPAWIEPLRRLLDETVRHLAEKDPRSMKYMRHALLRSNQ